MDRTAVWLATASQVILGIGGMAAAVVLGLHGIIDGQAVVACLIGTGGVSAGGSVAVHSATELSRARHSGVTIGGTVHER